MTILMNLIAILNILNMILTPFVLALLLQSFI